MVMNKGTAKEKVQMVNARHRRTARIETSSGFPDHNFIEPPPSAAAALALNPKLAPPAVASVRTIVRFALLSLLFCSLCIAAVLIVDTTVVIPSFAFPPLLPIVVVVAVVVIILALVVVFSFFFLPAMKFPISKGNEERAIVLLRCCCCCCCCPPPRKKLEPWRNDIAVVVSVIISRVLYICVCVYIAYLARRRIRMEITRTQSDTRESLVGKKIQPLCDGEQRETFFLDRDSCSKLTHTQL